jgi:hypothetical protein
LCYRRHDGVFAPTPRLNVAYARSRGISTEIHVSDILDPEKLWQEDLARANIDMLFGCYIGAAEAGGISLIKGE